MSFFGFRTLRRPILVIALSVGIVDAGLSFAACSSTDRTIDSSSGNPGEGGSEGGDPTDGGKDGPVTPTDSGKTTCAMPVKKGPCDLILQDCPKDSKGKDQECVVGGTADDPVTECVTVQASQQLPLGRGCCPNGSGNPCLPGLNCVGRPCEDGGPISGRCSPACCKGNDTACGVSDPEGITGACDLTIVNSKNKPLYDTCSYRERCKPFKVEPCKAGQVCLTEDKLGTASCLSSFGKGNGEACTFANECADGFICAGSGDAGKCRMVCLLPNTTHPFDAGVEDGGPLMGGCIAGETCRIAFDPDDLPGWFGACSDGGT